MFNLVAEVHMQFTAEVSLGSNGLMAELMKVLA